MQVSLLKCRDRSSVVLVEFDPYKCTEVYIQARISIDSQNKRGILDCLSAILRGMHAFEISLSVFLC